MRLFIAIQFTLAFIGDYGNPDEVLDAMEQVDFRPIEIGAWKERDDLYRDQQYRRVISAWISRNS